MPVPTTYTYPLSAIQNSSSVDLGRLEFEIEQSSIVTQLDPDGGILSVGGNLAVKFKDVLSASDKTTLDGGVTQDEEEPAVAGSILAQSNLGDRLNEPPQEVSFSPEAITAISVPRDVDDAPIYSPGTRQGSEVTFATHNFSDKLTWFCGSVRVTDEVPTSADGGVTWDLANASLIDMSHGRVMDEEYFTDKVVHGYAVVVTVDDVEKQVVKPFNEPPWKSPVVWDVGAEYRVDHENGKVVFETAQTGAVKVSYSYTGTSEFRVEPEAGKTLDIEKAEAQFSEDYVFNDTIVFQVYGYVESFAPTLWDQSAPVGELSIRSGTALPSVGSVDGELFYRDADNTLHQWDEGSASWGAVAAGPYPAGTRIPLVSTNYKTMAQIIDDAEGAFPVIPVMGGARGINSAVYGFPFHYATARRIRSGAGMRLEVSLENGSEFGGERTTATFYCVSKDAAG